MSSKIIEIARRESANNLYLLGDVKDRILGVDIRSSHALSEFFSPIVKSFAEITVLPGNHDSGLEKMLPSSVKIASPRGILLKEGREIIALLHGHASPARNMKKAETFIMGHRHFMLRIGNRYEPLWVKGRFSNGKRFIILPPFNELLTGSLFAQEKRSNSFVSKVLLNAERVEVFLLDGTFLGRLENLEEAVAEVEY